MDEIFRDQNVGIALFKLLADLIQKIFVITLVGYLAMHTRHIPEIWERRTSWKSYVVPIIIFGIFSIFGTYTGITMPNKAIVNFRDLGPMIAGLVAGPIVGLGAGLVGGIHRYFLGGETCLTCALATILIGLISGLVYKLNNGKFIGVFWAIIFAAAMEIGHVGLALIILKPFDRALEIASNVGPPMIVVNAVGMGVFAFIIRNLIREREIESEKDALRIELEVKSHELLIAREIQRSILPASPPVLAGYDMAADMWPAKQIGGDFYDFIPLEENPAVPDGYREHAIPEMSHASPEIQTDSSRLGIVIADVSGKGIPAAIFMAMSRTLVKACARPWRIAEVMEDVNQKMLADNSSGMFVTLFYGVLDPQKRWLRYTNAGHNPPILYQFSKSAIKHLNPLGPVLGVLENGLHGFHLKQDETELLPGDVLVLYTDGVTEAAPEAPDGGAHHGKAMEMFGMERLEKVIRENHTLSAQALLEKIQHEVRLFIGNSPQPDDLTLLVLKVL